MHEQESLLNIENHKDQLIFYKIMNYPIPRTPEYLLFEKKLPKPVPHWTFNKSFSWHKKTPYMEEYASYINKFWRLYKSLPFIQSLYICNSLSFNAIKKDSDIDLFIITKKNKLWRARAFSVLFFVIFWLKRSLTKKSKKFCLSFYITEDAQNLYSITLPKTDIYFSYWLAHLVPLYQEQACVAWNCGESNIYQHNKRLNVLLPNFPNEHIINIGTKMRNWTTRTKKIIEFFFGGLFGWIIERLIKWLRLPLVIHKTKKHGEDGWWIILSKSMLKFHMDIRKKVRVNYNLRKKWIHKSIYGIQEK